MKTAMQELIEKLDYSIKNSKDGYKINFEWIKFHAEILLEKEKEQILKAFELGMHECLAYDTNSINYYNQTYNQDNSFMNNGTWNTFSI